jgi:hypothetical protein
MLPPWTEREDMNEELVDRGEIDAQFCSPQMGSAYISRTAKLMLKTYVDTATVLAIKRDRHPCHATVHLI